MAMCSAGYAPLHVLDKEYIDILGATFSLLKNTYSFCSTLEY